MTEQSAEHPRKPRSMLTREYLFLILFDSHMWTQYTVDIELVMDASVSEHDQSHPTSAAPEEVGRDAHLR